MTHLIGIFAAFLTTISFLPQAIKVLKTKNTEGISLAMYAIFSSGVAFWLLYGILLKNPIIIISNGITLFLSILILKCKLRTNFK